MKNLSTEQMVSKLVN